jgi:hypothetical protein
VYEYVYEYGGKAETPSRRRSVADEVWGAAGLRRDRHARWESGRVAHLLLGAYYTFEQPHLDLWPENSLPASGNTRSRSYNRDPVSSNASSMQVTCGQDGSTSTVCDIYCQ